MRRITQMITAVIMAVLAATLLNPPQAQANQFQKSAFLTGSRLGYVAYANTDYDRHARRVEEALLDALRRADALDQGLVSEQGRAPTREARTYRRLVQRALNRGPHNHGIRDNQVRFAYEAALRASDQHTEDGSRTNCDIYIFQAGYAYGILLAKTSDPDIIKGDRRYFIDYEDWHFFRRAFLWDDKATPGGNAPACPAVNDRAFYQLSLAQWARRSIPLTRETGLIARREFNQVVAIVARAEADDHAAHNRPRKAERPRGGYDWDRSDGRYWDEEWDGEDRHAGHGGQHRSSRHDQDREWDWSRDSAWNRDQNRYGDYDRTRDRQTADADNNTRERTARFSSPRVNGKPLDQCYFWGRECGKPAADRFCQSQRYDEAVRFDVERTRPTWVMGDKKVCDAPYCAGFTEIVCKR